MKSCVRVVRCVFWGSLLLSRPALEAAEPIVLWDFSTENQHFEVIDPNSVWEWGLPAADFSPSEGASVWATGLTSTYVVDGYSRLISPSDAILDLSTYDDATLVLIHSYKTTSATSIEACTSGLEGEGTDDSSCGDGGLVRMLYDDGTYRLLEPVGGYSTVVNLLGEVEWAFGGDSGGYIASYFDLLGNIERAFRLELLFLSNSTLNRDGWYISSLALFDGDLIPPTISGSPYSDTSAVDGPFTIEVNVSDNRGLASVIAEYEIDNSEAVEVLALTSMDGISWAADIPASFEAEQLEYDGVEIAYRITATDINGNEARYPVEGRYTFVVGLDRPADLDRTDSNRQALGIDLTWTRPEDPAAESYQLVGYRILHSAYDSTGNSFGHLNEVYEDQDQDDKDLNATVSAVGYPYTDEYRVCGVFQRDGEEPICGLLSDAEPTQLIVPSILSLTPARAFAGESLEITVVGANTSFFEGDTTIQFDRNLRVISVDVRDVTYLTAQVEVPKNTGSGTIEMSILSRGLTLIYEEGFIVQPGTERPGIESVEPDHVRAGDQKTIKFATRNTEFNISKPTVDFGSGISAGEVVVVSADEFEVPIKVAVWANGERQIQVISGGDTYTASFIVESETVGGETCAYSAQRRSAGLSMHLVVLLSGILFLRRRRAHGRSWYLRCVWVIRAGHLFFRQASY